MKPTIEVLLRSHDTFRVVCFRVFTEEQKAACLAAGDGAEEIYMSIEVGGGGRKFEIIRANGNKIWERQL